MSGVMIAISRITIHIFAKLNQESIQLLTGLGIQGDSHMGKTLCGWVSF
jgi:hypothetical protein